MANYREPQWLLPNEKNLQYPEAGATYGSGLSADRHSLYSMDFDGNNYISCETITQLGNLTQATWSGWFNRGTSSGSHYIMGSWGTSGTERQFLVLQTPTALTVFMGLGQYGNQRTMFQNTSLTFTTGEWYHLAFVYDESETSNADKMKVYINGSLQINQSAGAAINFVNPVTSPFIIGTIGGYLTNKFLGKIDEVAVFSRALSFNEVNTLWNNGAPSNPMLLSGKPVAYYPLGEQARKPGTAEWRFPNEVLQGQAIDFDGSTDFIDLGTKPIVTGEFSISMWIKRSSTSVGDATQVLIGKDNQSAARVFNIFFKNITGQISFWVSSTGTYSGTYRVDTSTAINDTNWHNIVFLNKGDGQLNEIYIDGVEASYTAQGQGRSTLFNTTGIKTSLGADALTGTTYNFNGQISNVAIWNSDQSANITNIYNYGAPQTSYTVTPTAWYKLDKTSKFTGLNPNWHSALDFVASENDYIDLGTDSSLDIFGGDFSVSLWFNHTISSPNKQPLIEIADASFTNKMALTLGLSGNTGVGFAVGPATPYPVWNFNAGSGYNDGNWHHIVATRTGTTYKIYVDNEELSFTQTGNWAVGSDNAIAVGRSSAVHFDGKISNVAIYDQVISPEDIKYLYNGGTPQTNISFEPVSWWKLDNLTTGIQDSGSASNNGTNNGATAVSSSVAVDEWVFENTVQSQTPNWSSALDFSGNNQWIDCGIDSSIDTGDLSVAFWFNKDSSASGFQYVFNSGSGSAKAGFVFAFSGTDIYIGRKTRTHTAGFTTYTNIGISADKWHHIALTYNDTSNNFIAYLDGQSVHTSTGTTATNAASSEIIFGRISNVASSYYKGKISNAAIFTSELDSTAITALYNNGTPETSISSSPVSWWKLDNTTTGIQDSGSSGNNGTNNGATEIQTNVWTPRLNGESSTLPSSALTSSDLQFNSAYSSFSLNFDPGGPDYINLGDLSNIGVSNASAASVSLWFKKDGNGNYVLFELKEGSSKIALQSYLTNGLYIYINNISYNVSTTVANGEWHNIILVFDGSGATNADKLKLYFNGSNITGGAYSGTVPTSVGAFTSSMTSNLGRTPTTAYFDGRMDECSIFNKALNQAEVTSIYNNGYPKDITALAPVSWWRLGEDAYFDGTDFTIPNKISGAPNGTSDNMTATDLVADAPGSYAAGLGSSLALADRVGDAPLSTANSLSFNMTPENRISYPAGYTPTQVDNVYSMDFDGTNDYIEIPNNDSLDLVNTDFSISIWLNPDISHNGIVISHYYGSNGWGVYYQSGSIRFYDAPVWTTLTTISTGQWSHILIVGDYTGSNLLCYKNGVEVYNSSHTFSITDANINLFIASERGTGFFFDGKIDEVAIFDYALTPRQIKQDIYNGTTSGKTADLNNNSNLTPPVAWYRMGD